MKRIILIGMVVLGVLGMAACNTIAGAGRDVQHAGRAIEHTAEDAKH